MTTLTSASAPRVLGWVAASAALLPLVIGGIALDAAHRRAAREREQPALLAVVRHLPGSDLALSGGARWLRFPSLEEPGAAFSENPAATDADPAGGMISPPCAVWALEATPP